MGLASLGGKLYAIGGRFNTFEYNTNLLDIYDPVSNSWASAKPMPTARSGMAVSVLNEKILYSSYNRKLWIRCGNEKGGVPFRVEHANPGGSRVEGGRHRC
jgi:hypothetical protein